MLWLCDSPQGPQRFSPVGRTSFLRLWEQPRPESSAGGIHHQKTATPRSVQKNKQFLKNHPFNIYIQTKSLDFLQKLELVSPAVTKNKKRYKVMILKVLMLSLCSGVESFCVVTMGKWCDVKNQVGFWAEARFRCRGFYVAANCHPAFLLRSRFPTSRSSWPPRPDFYTNPLNLTKYETFFYA